MGHRVRSIRALAVVWVTFLIAPLVVLVPDATAELVHYDNLMLCKPGEAGEFFDSGATWRTGTTPVNVSGGLQSKGHPIAATGIANI